jgi:hypothetical protein
MISGGSKRGLKETFDAKNSGQKIPRNCTFNVLRVGSSWWGGPGGGGYANVGMQATQLLSAFCLSQADFAIIF